MHRQSIGPARDVRGQRVVEHAEQAALELDRQAPVLTQRVELDVEAGAASTLAGGPPERRHETQIVEDHRADVEDERLRGIERVLHHRHQLADFARGGARVALDQPLDDLRLDWAEQLEARIGASRAVAQPRRTSAMDLPAPEHGKDLPPALATMFEERLADERDAAEAAIRDSIVALPAANWREIQGRAASSGVVAELLADGSELRLVADIPALETPSEG